jgi:Na+/melibiose symporter-like transporter
MDEGLRHLEFLTSNSKEIVEKQVDSYRQQHSYAGTIIGVTVLFIPFFLNGLDGTLQVIQFIAIIPVAFFIVAILLLLSLFRSKPLDQAFAVVKYKELLLKSYREILLYEIDANANSYTKNIRVTEKANQRYTNGVQLTTIAILISITLLLANKFIAIEQVPAKEQVVSGNKLKLEKVKATEAVPIKKILPIQKH